VQPADLGKAVSGSASLHLTKAEQSSAEHFKCRAALVLWTHQGPAQMLWCMAAYGGRQGGLSGRAHCLKCSSTFSTTLSREPGASRSPASAVMSTTLAGGLIRSFIRCAILLHDRQRWYCATAAKIRLELQCSMRCSMHLMHALSAQGHMTLSWQDIGTWAGHEHMGSLVCFSIRLGGPLDLHI